MDFVLLDSELQQIAGIGPPIDIGIGVDALFCQLDRKEVLVRTGEITDRDDLAFQIGKLVDARIHMGQHAHAAAMGAGGDLDIKPLLQRLQPAQGHTKTRVGLAGRDGFQ